jgi:hypothetical protein
MLARLEWSIPDLFLYSCLQEDNFSSSPLLLKPLLVNAAGEAGILERAKEACCRCLVGSKHFRYPLKFVIQDSQFASLQKRRGPQPLFKAP